LTMTWSMEHAFMLQQIYIRALSFKDIGRP
jgi:hypothetical protein